MILSSQEEKHSGSLSPSPGSYFIILPSCLLTQQVRKNSLGCTSAIRGSSRVHVIHSLCRDGKELLIHFWEIPRLSLPGAPPPQSRGEVAGQQPLSLFLVHWPGARVRFWCKPPSQEWHELSPGELLHCSEPGKMLRRWKGFFPLMTDCTDGTHVASSLPPYPDLPGLLPLRDLLPAGQLGKYSNPSCSTLHRGP